MTQMDTMGELRERLTTTTSDGEGQAQEVQQPGRRSTINFTRTGDVDDPEDRGRGLSSAERFVLVVAVMATAAAAPVRLLGLKRCGMWFNVLIFGVYAPTVLLQIVQAFRERQHRRKQGEFQAKVIELCGNSNASKEARRALIQSWSSGCCTSLWTGLLPEPALRRVRECQQGMEHFHRDSTTRCTNRLAGCLHCWKRGDWVNRARRLFSRLSALVGLYLDIFRTISMSHSHPAVASLMVVAIILPVFARAYYFRPYEVESMMEDQRWGAWLWTEMASWKSMRRDQARSWTFRTLRPERATFVAWFCIALVYLPMRDAWLLLYWFQQEPLNAPDFHYLNLRWLAQVFLSKTVMTVLQGVVLILDLLEGKLVPDLSLFGPLAAFLTCVSSVCSGCAFMNWFASLQTEGSWRKYMQNMFVLGEGFVSSSLLEAIRQSRVVHITSGQLEGIRGQGLMLLSQCIGSSKKLEELTLDLDAIDSLRKIRSSLWKNFFGRLLGCSTLRKLHLKKTKGQEVTDEMRQAIEDVKTIVKEYRDHKPAETALHIPWAEEPVAKYGGKTDCATDSDLTRAVEEGSLAKVLQILSNDGPSQADLFEAMKSAIDTYNVVFVMLLLLAGADPRGHRPDPEAPSRKSHLYFAVASAEIVTLLLALWDTQGQDLESGPKGADLLQEALALAAQEGFHRSLQQFLDSKYLSKLNEESLSRALGKAASRGHLSCVKQLLEHRASVESHEERTPLQWSAMEGHLPVLQLLVESKENQQERKDYINYTSQTCSSALFYSAHKGHLECVRWLLAHSADPLIGAKLETKPPQPRTPLEAVKARETSQGRAIRKLLEEYELKWEVIRCPHCKTKLKPHRGGGAYLCHRCKKVGGNDATAWLSCCSGQRKCAYHIHPECQADRAHGQEGTADQSRQQSSPGTSSRRSRTQTQE